ncbi:SMI1/KNR4 family protein [Couchioplanes azureus]|uniref:SMI1/KNR4 family protein n=1 Tax=Couchioplanes caeruleus TaxID=56438 RepID=UPI00166F9E63|nr:SMI1/KNR4 family protein [Couchioplanes caeruleus]GGQ72286.1 hypothetical protein GCM10010166_47730 [Couchioplanes caeruleus subsp. azureus]
MQESVTGTLEQIDAWLATNCPAVQSTLPAPASSAQLDHLQALTGIGLLPQVEQLYRWHNGSAGLPQPFWLAPDHGFLTLDDALDEWRTYNQVVADTFSDPSEAAWLWSREWLPIGSAWAGSILVVDHSPGPGQGSVFTVQHGTGARRNLGWPSIAVLLHELATTLTTGTPMRERTLTVGPDKLTWN